MRVGPPDEVLSGAAGWGCQVASWLGSDLLSADVPVMAGHITGDIGSEVPERLTLTVPGYSVVDGHRFSWCPRDDARHPLARYGQQLAVTILVTSSVTGQVWDTRVGRFVIQNWQEDEDGSVAIEAAGRLQTVADDRLPSPMSPIKGGSLLSEFTRLLPPGFAVDVNAALVNRGCPSSMEWSEERLGALYDIADAWPARLRTDPNGMLLLLPALPEVATSPVVTLVDGERGTVVSAARSDTRDRIYNRVVARSADGDDPSAPPIQAVANLTTGPMRTTGPYGIVTRFYASPLITTKAQATSAAKTLLATAVLPSRAIPVELSPDPRIDLDDAVAVRRDGDERIGFVTSYDLPLTVMDGPMQVTVGIGPPDDEEEGT